MSNQTTPRGIRNNNPLNIRYNVNNKWCGRVETEKKTRSLRNSCN